MTKWLLIIFFINSGGEAIILDGWHPREHPTKEVCEQRLEFLKNYLDENKDSILPQGIVEYDASCIEQE